MITRLTRRSAFLSTLFAFCLSVQGKDQSNALSILEEREAAGLDLLPWELVKREDESPENFFHFASRPDLMATKWNITTFHPNAIAPGYWFLAPYASLEQNGTRKPWVGPYIYDQEGELVWSGTPLLDNWNAYDFNFVDLNGEHLLSFLNMHDRSGIFLNSNYGEYDRVWANPNNASLADMHEFHVLPGGTALTVIRDPTPSTEEEALAIGVHGPCDAAWRGFMEVDLATNQPIFEWSAHGHIGLNESMTWAGTYEEMCEVEWDILHLNAVDKFPDGDYLLSSRHTNAIYKISHTDGSIVWRLGGVRNDFKKDFHFSRQHHARVRSQNSTHITMTFLDNAIGSEKNETKTNPYSRGLLVSLRTDTQPMRAHVLQEYIHPSKKLVSSRGSANLLSNGNVFICWTHDSLMSEHKPTGELLMEAKTTAKLPTYRMYEGPWVGRPSAPPDVFAKASRRKGSDVAETNVFVSWNGDTEVKTWRMLRSNEKGDYTEFLKSKTRHGFETVITYPGYVSHIVMEGLDARNASLGRSQVVETHREAGLTGVIVDQDEAWMQAHASNSSLPTFSRPATYSSSSTPVPSQSAFHSYSYAASPPSSPTDFVGNDKTSSSAIDADDDYGDDDGSLWDDVQHSTTTALTSTTAYIYYGIPAAIFASIGVWSVLRCRRRRQSYGDIKEDPEDFDEACPVWKRPFERLAWWRSGDSTVKYGPVWDEREIEEGSEDGADDDDLKFDVVDPRLDDDERRPLR